MFLTTDELVTLTGLVRPSSQARWLRAHRVRHFVNAAGRVVVARAWLVGNDDAVVVLPERPNLRAVSGKA